MFTRRRGPEWRWENGPGYELRQYHGGKPTTLVAVTALDDPRAARRVVEGPDAWLIHEPGRITVAERRQGPNTMRLRIPVPALVAIDLVDEPGLPGSSMVRLTMTVRLGPTGTFTVPLWFPERSRPVLDALIHALRPPAQPTGSAPTPIAAPVPKPPELWLTPLAVDRSPDDEDWVVFRAASGDDVVAPRPEGESR